MTTFHSNPHRTRGQQDGFVVPYVLLAIILIAAVVAFMAQSGNSAKPQAQPEQNKLNADAIIQGGVDLRDASMRFSMDRDINAMTLDTTAGTGLYDPALALLTAPSLPAAASTTGSAPAFALDKANIAVTNLGTATPEIAIIAGNLTTGVCASINNVLYGELFTGTLPNSVGTRQEGCAALTTPTGNTYYKVVQGL